MRYLLRATVVTVVAFGAATLTASSQVVGTGDVCPLLTQEVIGRLGPNVRVLSCDAETIDGEWTAALPDSSARLGEESWFTLTGPGGARRIQATLVAEGPHARTVRRVGRGLLLDAGDVRAETGVLTGARILTLASADGLTGARVMRVLDSDAIIQAPDVALPPVIKSGSKVIAVVRIGAVEVTATMTALDAGAIGDDIRIAHPDRKRVLHAKVVGPGRVEVVYAQ
jgi:flagella basal body P-ring formation protein FlgA